NDVLVEVLQTNAELRKDLQAMLALILSGDRGQELAEQRQRVGALLATLRELRNQQARLQARTERGGQAGALRQEQEKLTAATKALLPADREGSPEDAIRKPVEAALQRQRQAEGKLGKGNAPGAAEDQGQAVSRLDEAIRALEALERQIRQEEQERRLEGLLV